MPLSASLIAAADLDSPQIDAMYALMSAHYIHAHRDEFGRDLAAKDWVILLHDEEQGILRGFSTQVCFTHRHQGATHRILFSGDTIIHPDAWGGMQLPIMFGRMMLAVRRLDPEERLFWMLISKGFRTYRFLPTFFRQFFPCRGEPVPEWEQALMQALGRRRFPDSYDASAGIVRAGRGAQSLRPELAADRCHRTHPNPHIEFFLQRNPGHDRGDELLCLAEFRPDNLKPFILRQLDRGRVELPSPGSAAVLP